MLLLNLVPHVSPDIRIKFLTFLFFTSSWLLLRLIWQRKFIRFLILLICRKGWKQRGLKYAECKPLLRCNARVMNKQEGPLSLFSIFVSRGSSHRRKSAACPKFDMVWLYHSPIPVGWRGVIYSFKWFLPALTGLEDGGGEGQHPVDVNHTSMSSVVQTLTQEKARSGIMV